MRLSGSRLSIFTAMLLLAPAMSAFGGGSTPHEMLVTIAREQDTLAPGTAFRVGIEVGAPRSERALRHSVTLPNGSIALLQKNPDDHGYWAKMDFPSLAAMQAALNGTWTVSLADEIESTSTFELNAAALGESSFFASPEVVSPLEGGGGIPANLAFFWNAPVSGPFPPYLVNTWIDHLVYGPGPSDLLPPDATAWDPNGCMPAGPIMFGLAYIVPIDTALLTPFTVHRGNVEWLTPKYAPPGYPAGTPLVALAGETRRYFDLLGPDPIADLNCDGNVNGADLAFVLGSWGTPDSDINGDGNTDGADLALVLGSWTG